MSFIPHTEAEVAEMLAAIGVDRLEALFDEIPAALRVGGLEDLPTSLGELEVTRLMAGRAEADRNPVCFLGAGAYEHHIPAAVWELVTRGEYYSAYTPYQAEASQGTLQLLYEFQTMICRLLAMDVANASLYEGASALAEAVLMAARANKVARDRRCVLIPRTVHPRYRETVRAIVSTQDVEVTELSFDPQGRTSLDELERAASSAFALVIPQPNFFGCLETVDTLTDVARRTGLTVIGVVNPVAMALLKPPGQWGSEGVDIVCGEGQPLGVPLAAGGPYFGFMACRAGLVRQMPGRIVGRTLDRKGNAAFTLTLQAREQHIRRAKATSNICTNQGLLTTAATIYMAVMGRAGLTDVARRSHQRLGELVNRLTALPGVTRHFPGPVFNESVLTLPRPAASLLKPLLHAGILGGYDLSSDYPDLGDTLLVCATEVRSVADLDRYQGVLAQALTTD